MKPEDLIMKKEKELPIGTKVRVHCRHLNTWRSGKITSKPIIGSGMCSRVIYFKVSGISGNVNYLDIIKE